MPIEFALKATSLFKAVLGLAPCQPVDLHEVAQQFLALRGIAGEAHVCGRVTKRAERLEAAQLLIARPKVERPHLVAVQARLPTAGPAAIARLAVGSAPESVPMLSGQEVGQTGPARAGGQGFEAQAEVGHVQLFGRAALLKDQEACG